MYGTPQIKLPTKSSLQHTLGLQTRARNLNKNYCVPTEDVKLLRRNLRACLQEVTSSFRLFKLARSALQMMKYFSHRHKLQRFEAGLNGAACFKIFQVKLNPILASFKCQMCLLSSVLSLLLGSLKEDIYIIWTQWSVIYKILLTTFTFKLEIYKIILSADTLPEQINIQGRRCFLVIVVNKVP